MKETYICVSVYLFVEYTSGPKDAMFVCVASNDMVEDPSVSDQ